MGVDIWVLFHTRIVLGFPLLLFEINFEDT